MSEAAPARASRGLQAGAGAGQHRAPGARLALALVSALVLGGCAGDSASKLLAGTGTAPASAATAGVPPPASTPDEPTRDKPAFNPFVEQSESNRPIREVIEKPTFEDVTRTGTLPEFSLGHADAPVTLVKYMSLTCPYCRRFQAETFPVLKRDYIDTGKVRLVIREFPIGKASGTATIALRCAPMSSYLELYGKFLAQQTAWVAQEVRHDAIARVAAQVGVTREQYDACVADARLIDELKRVKDRGRQLGVIGTPNFFVDDRLVKKVVGMKELRELIDPLLARSSPQAP